MDNLIWGLEMTVLGMGLVFGLLALLWGLLTIVQRLDTQPAAATASMAEAEPADAGATAEAAEAAPAVRIPASVQGMDAELVAAIVAAALAHRALRRREAAPVMRSYLPGSQLHVSRWVTTGRAMQTRHWSRRSS
jgi:Na+-transporting methylmalonyl-CoA/oxaloacetate decarboxylase gamma subunit